MKVSSAILITLFHLGSANVLNNKIHASLDVNIEDEFVPYSKSSDLGSSLDLRETSGGEDVTIYQGVWGRWMGWRGTHDTGLYACGADLRFEGGQGAGDDTAANGLKLKYCRLDNWDIQSTIDIFDGNWGGWKGMRMCDKDYYIDGAQVRFEGQQGGGDDTALNGIHIRCRHKTTNSHRWVNVYSGIWGDWKHHIYRTTKFVKFAQVRYEEDQGGGDDTAMNGLRFLFYTPSLGLSKQGVQARWVMSKSGNNPKHSITTSATLTDGTTVTRGQSSSISATISAGFDFKGFSSSVSITGTQAQSVSRSVTRTLQAGRSETFTMDCGGTSPTGMWYMFQWEMEQKSDSNGRGFKIDTEHYRCTPRIDTRPKCPFFECDDSVRYCQKCKGSSSCKDSSQHCPYWKNKGFCSHSYVDYMHAHCKKSCGVCR